MKRLREDGSAAKRWGVWRGIFAALVTPMRSDGTLDVRTLESLVDRLIREGVHGLVPLGSTGEFYALSPDERQRVLRATLGAAAGRVPVVAGANAGATRDVNRHYLTRMRLRAHHHQDTTKENAFHGSLLFHLVAGR